MRDGLVHRAGVHGTGGAAGVEALPVGGFERRRWEEVRVVLAARLGERELVHKAERHVVGWIGARRGSPNVRYSSRHRADLIAAGLPASSRPRRSAGADLKRPRFYDWAGLGDVGTDGDSRHDGRR